MDSLFTGEVGNALIELHAMGMELLRVGRKRGDVVRGDLESGARVIRLLARLGQVGGNAISLMLGGGKLPAHVGQARNHVAALLLEQAHVRVDATDDVLHMTALLAQISDEQPFFLEHDLKLFEFTLFLVQAIFCELIGGLGLFRGGLVPLPLLLEAPQLIHRENLRKFVGARRKLLVFARAIDLTLERTELT